MATKRPSAMERELLEKVMAWFQAQKRGLAVQEADAVFNACERLEAMRAPRAIEADL